MFDVRCSFALAIEFNRKNRQHHDQDRRPRRLPQPSHSLQLSRPYASARHEEQVALPAQIHLQLPRGGHQIMLYRRVTIRPSKAQGKRSTVRLRQSKSQSLRYDYFGPRLSSNRG